MNKHINVAHKQTHSNFADKQKWVWESESPGELCQIAEDYKTLHIAICTCLRLCTVLLYILFFTPKNPIWCPVCKLTCLLGSYTIISVKVTIWNPSYTSVSHRASLISHDTLKRYPELITNKPYSIFLSYYAIVGL